MKTLILVYALVLCACAPAPTASVNQAPVVAQSTPAPLKPMMIYVEGDSTMYGANAHETNGPIQGQSMYNAPAMMQSGLAVYFGAGIMMVQNHAESGSSLQDTLNGTDSYGVTFEQRMHDIPSDFVLTNSALNDDGPWNTVEKYKNDLRTWIAIARKYGKIPVLEEPNPATCTFTIPLTDFVQAIRDIGVEQQVDVIAQYDYIQSLPNWPDMLQDCEHPKDELYKIKGIREADAMAKIINRVNGR